MWINTGFHCQQTLVKVGFPLGDTRWYRGQRPTKERVPKTRRLFPHGTKEARINTSVVVSFARAVSETVHVVHSVLLNDDFLGDRDEHIDTNSDANFLARLLGHGDQVSKNTVLGSWNLTTKIESFNWICLLLSRCKCNRCFAGSSRVCAVARSETTVLIESVPVLIDLSPARTVSSTVQDDVEGSDFSIEGVDLVLSRESGVAESWDVFLNKNVCRT